MPQRYIHLSGRDHINAVLEAQGLEVPREQRPKPMLAGDHCPHCDGLIGASMLYCPGCGYVLDDGLRDEAVVDAWKKKAGFDERLAEVEKLLKRLTGEG